MAIKYDGVYWPHIDLKWIWHCPESGYTSFGDDLDKLTSDEIAAIRSYLQGNYRKLNTNIGTEQKLGLLEASYTIRPKNDAFWAWYKRVKAVIYESLAAKERYESIPLLKEEIKSVKPSFDLVQKLYVLSDYYRQAGDETKAEELFQQALSVKWIDKDINEVTGSLYIETIINERRALMKHRR